MPQSLISAKRNIAKAADAPNFECYDENFDSLTGSGGLEIWIPVKD